MTVRQRKDGEARMEQIQGDRAPRARAKEQRTEAPHNRRGGGAGAGKDQRGSRRRAAGAGRRVRAAHAKRKNVALRGRKFPKQATAFL